MGFFDFIDDHILKPITNVVAPVIGEPILKAVTKSDDVDWNDGHPVFTNPQKTVPPVPPVPHVLEPLLKHTPGDLDDQTMIPAGATSQIQPDGQGHVPTTNVHKGKTPDMMELAMFGLAIAGIFLLTK